jgi:uncharacterized phage protein gp47/JayE
MPRSKDEIIVDLITNILREEERADVMPGQVLRDVSIQAPAAEMENLYNQVDNVSISQSLFNANIMTTSQLDDLVFNWGLTRRGASKALGQVTFYSSTIPSTVVTIKKDTQLGTSIGVNGVEITFQTRGDVTFDPISEGNFYNPNTGQWELSVDVIAVNPGSQGNVGSFTITNIKNANIPFNVTNNLPCTGGVDQESNASLATRALAAVKGSNAGTRNGYLGLALSQNDILDAIVAGPGDPLMTRDGGFGGKVDIWNIVSAGGYIQADSSTVPSLLIEDFNEGAEFNKNGGKYVFPILPVDFFSPITITASTAPSGVTNVLLYESHNIPTGTIPYMDPAGAGYHYTLYAADDLDTGHSYQSNDYIQWNLNEMQYLRTFNPSGLANTGNTMDVSIVYTYDNAINVLQTTLDAPVNKILTADVLAKEAIKILVNVSMSVQLLPSFTTTEATENQTIGNIVASISQTINNNKLGNTIQESDLVTAAHNVPGVDNVILSSVVLTKNRPIYYDTNAEQITDDTTLQNEYFESDTITITVV